MSFIPVFPHDVKVQFGQDLDFSDLLQEHEEKHGKLWKYVNS